ncbi:hypothetical protein [Escherichia phage UPEC01]|uniref:Uncharacterized protein n=1 Tax=Escherichia phage vB_EcoM_VR26 TaxID=1567029 RepID=A0A0A7HDY8_9CAUD|nr:hypothetical protein AVV66_gp156 [Escherichia phage vB_EcoM_VR26]AIZ02918.1 hypothetical protein VR26_281 [Escherichia phage vB_EcoM_VR26]QIN95602.1 hypothetical protein MN01_00224 [Escherichia phage MN01]QMV33902.1 hypothetical protein [Escherichia phage DK-13]QQG30924.1 hypothetical protein [Escherichia phage UPEC01]
MKLFKDIAVGEKFVLGNGQQLIRISPLMDNSERPVRTENCLDYPFYQKRFAIENNTECFTVDELMESSEEVDLWDGAVDVE